MLSTLPKEKANQASSDINIDGDSYRMRSHRARAEATRKAVKDS